MLQYSSMFTDCRILASVYNPLAVPHLLTLASFWSLLTTSNIRNIQRCFYKYAKYLLIKVKKPRGMEWSSVHGAAKKREIWEADYW